MNIEIKNRWSGSVVFSTDAKSLGHAIIAALKAKANLTDADLTDADLRGADLTCANLRGANLRGADLMDADLMCADLTCANLRGADLMDADLMDADLTDADLTCADLRGANLRGADLRGADLRGANLSPEVLERLISQRIILPDGELIVYKKLANGIICKLRIPAKAKRVGGLIGRKCRAEYAYVISGEGVSERKKTFQYKKGKKVTPDKFDPNPLVECSHGIHFFITKKEAELY